MNNLKKIILFICGGCFSAVFCFAEFHQVHVKNGVLYFDDGKEAALWGVNFQPSLSWEYSRMKQAGLHHPFNKTEYLKTIDAGFDDLQQLNVNLIRIHISPADFSDASGNLVENQWLDLTDYVLAEAEKRGMYIYLAFLNDMKSGLSVPESFISKAGKSQWMVDPEFIKKSENFIRQLLNRRNSYSAGNKKYKDNPALVIVEPINEPGYLKYDELNEHPACAAVYQSWLRENKKRDSSKTFLEWRRENTKEYINRMVRFFKKEICNAVMAWNMEWPRMMEWTGTDVFDAAAESDAEVVSICLYPGQSDAHNKSGEDLKQIGEINYLPYLKKVYETQSWHGWLLEERFKQKARIVYEFETYYNQTSYLYPAMAKLFRAFGIQAAAMWTYILPGQAERTAAAHHLNLKTTPGKAASFMIAGELFKNTPRFEKYLTTSDKYNLSRNSFFSFETGSSVYCNNGLLIYSDTVQDDIAKKLMKSGDQFQTVIGRGTSPEVRYDGTGLYFIEYNETVSVEILPDAEFIHPHYLRSPEKGTVVALSTNIEHSFELRLPGVIEVDVFRENGGLIASEIHSGFLKFKATPGTYRIKQKKK